MKKKILFFSLIILFLGFLLRRGAGTGGGVALAHEPMQGEEIQQHIRSATIQISIEVPDPDIPNVTIVETGFGTLILRNGETFLVTHSHWKQLSERHGHVYLRDIDNQIQFFSHISDFQRRIWYRDQGTTIYKVPAVVWPDTLAYKVARSDPALPEVGDTVLITHREILNTGSGKSIQVTFHQARVQGVESKNGLPVFRLVSQNDHAVVPGDSGGGVWFKGHLVANMWTTIMEESDSGFQIVETDDGLQPTDISIAAHLPQS